MNSEKEFLRDLADRLMGIAYELAERAAQCRVEPEPVKLVLPVREVPIAPSAPGSRSFQHWTMAQDEELRKLSDQGMTPPEIAQRVGRSRGSIAVRLRRIGYGPKREKREVRHLVQVNPVAHVAAAQPEPPNGLARNHTHWSAKDDALIRQRWENGVPVEAIAGELRRTPMAIYNRASRLHLSSRLVPSENRPYNPSPLRLPTTEGTKTT